MNKKASIIVTNHTLVRYLERVAGIDVDRLRRGIRRKVRHAVNSGAKSITVDGFTYRLEGRTVVTIIPADESHEPARAFGEMVKAKGDE